MSMIKLQPACKNAIWGGSKLIEDFGKSSDTETIAESWELSVHPDGESIIASGEDSGLSLSEYIRRHGKSILGKNCERFADFPILIKFIDAKADLSVQVHPDDEYALLHEGQYGKTEMWYVLDAEPGATLCYGCKNTITKDDLRSHIENNTLDRILNMVPAKKGDVFFIESKTIHAIGAGIVVAEIQQNSNVTYRVYDYGRKGADGKPRELHIEQAIDVADLTPPVTNRSFGGHIASCDIFTVDLLKINNDPYSGNAADESFVSLLVTEGQAMISCGSDQLSAKKGDSIFIEANSGSFTVSGTCDILMTTIPPKH